MASTALFSMRNSQCTRRVHSSRRPKRTKKATAAKTEAKKEKNIREKVENASATFELFKSVSNMPAEAWQDIIKFLVPLYNNKSTPLKLNSVKKAKYKAVSFDKEYDPSWDMGCIDGGSIEEFSGTTKTRTG